MKTPLFLKPLIVITLGSFLTFNALAEGSQSHCGNIDLTGTWIPQYQMSRLGSSHDYSNADRLDFAQKGCDLVVTDVKNNEVWHVDLSSKVSTPVPTTAPIRATNDPEDRAILSSLYFNSVLGGGGSYNASPNILLNGRGKIPATTSKPFTVEFGFKVYLMLGMDDSVYASPEFQQTGQYPIPMPISHINMTFGDPNGTSDERTSAFKILSVNSPVLPGPLANAFVKGANYVLGLKFISNLTDFSDYSSLTLIKVSAKQF